MKSKWNDWNLDDLTKEILDRINYLYRQTNGEIQFPNNVEGDLLKMVYIVLTKNKE